MSTNNLFRCRIEPETLAKANQVAEELGTTTPDLVRMFLTEVATTGRAPISGFNRPDLETAIWEAMDCFSRTFRDSPHTEDAILAFFSSLESQRRKLKERTGKDSAGKPVTGKETAQGK